jgi:hypothetical protein
MMTTAQLGSLVANGLEDLKILYPISESTFEITEATNENQKGGSINPLKKITISNLPTSNIWIFDSEPNVKCFGGGGNKVEKSILYLANGKLYVMMIEMKSTMNKKNLDSLEDKFICSLTKIAIFLSGNQTFVALKNTPIVPIGIACFNGKTINEQDARYSAKCNDFLQLPTQFKNKTKLLIEPVTLNRIDMPLLFFQNPYFVANSSAASDNFTIPFPNILPIKS